jgi:hypothetical protein
MKRFVSEFIRRGLIACGLGPIVLSVFYLIFSHFSAVEVLRVSEVCTGIFSLSALAFIAGGMNTIYQIERLPLMVAIFIHGGVLYIGYLCTYLLNDWLAWGSIPILVFSGIFIVGYFVIWAIIYIIIKKNTEKINQILKTKQQNAENL